MKIHNIEQSFEILGDGRKDRKCPTSTESVQKQKREEATVQSLNSWLCRAVEWHTFFGQIVHEYGHMEQILSGSMLMSFFVIIYCIVLFVVLFLLMWTAAPILYSNICSRTLQINVCEGRCVMVPNLYHKIGELTAYLFTDWFLHHLQQEGVVAVWNFHNLQMIRIDRCVRNSCIRD